MGDVIPIVTNEDAIESLAIYLDEAKKGNLQGFSIVLDGAYACHGVITPELQHAYLHKGAELMLAYLDDDDDEEFEDE